MLKRGKSTKQDKTDMGDMGVMRAQERPKVSVIVPVQNSEDYFPILLHQLHEQNFSDFEVLVIDAGSTDGSMAFAKEYSMHDPRFKVLDQVCDGKSAARNLGVAKSQGEYITSFDPDDMINADILECMVAPLKRYKSVDVVLCDMDEFYDPDRKFRAADWIVDKEKIPPAEPFKASDIDGFYKGICGYPTNKMIRRSLYDRYKLKWQEIKMHDDMSLTQAALSLARKVFFVDQKLYHGRVRKYDPANTQMTNENYDCMFEALLEIKRTLKKHKAWKKFENSFNNYALDQCRWKYFAVTPEARQGAHDSLRNTWLEKLGISDLSEDEFESKQDYLWMRSVMESPDFMEELPPDPTAPSEEVAASDSGESAESENALEGVAD